MHKLNIKNVKAIIFDMDGTIVDNNKYHFNAMVETLKAHDINMNYEEFMQYMSGRGVMQGIENFVKDKLTKNEIEDIANEKESLYRDLYKGNIQEIEGFKDFVGKLKSKNIKVAIATGAPKPNKELIDLALGLDKYMDLIIDATHVKKSKPDPEIFLFTAKELYINPKDCIVFEDAPAGVKAGLNAGMKVIGVLSSHTDNELNGTEFNIKDYREIVLLSN